MFKHRVRNKFYFYNFFFFARFNIKHKEFENLLIHHFLFFYLKVNLNFLNKKKD